ncbi:response regulator [Rhodopila sp.]|jgi:DNA-binding NtrC family response regulator|uniref:response regulator n=1 Tax=Rhodopila sp. TaxID=2480087 RepID=UPI002CE45396|nr:response regulator [Rhodopila sp.]HVZ09001.1 response regulator [Rhodopila sp.]
MQDQLHILVVEDDPLVSEVISAALEDRFATTVVVTAAEAMQVLKDRATRLVLLDCTLPGGLDPALLPAADELGIPVVLMSGDHQRIEQVGGTPRPFMLKPFTLDGLLEIVEQVLGLR